MNQAELIALELSAAALGDAAQDRVNEYVWEHDSTTGMPGKAVNELANEVEHVMNNRIILKLKGN